jgi:hypothetical protein
MTNENQYEFSGKSAKRYRVEIEKENGWVSNINIYKTDNETNDICYNGTNTIITEFAEITGYIDENISENYDNNINVIENTSNEQEENKKSKLDYIIVYVLDWSNLFVICIWIPFIIVLCTNYKFSKKMMNTGLYDYKKIKRRKKLIVIVFIITCLVSYIWIKYLETTTISELSCR